MKLDVGCGYTCSAGFVGVDSDFRVMPDLVADACDLKLSDGCAEVVYSRRCVQHIPDDSKALREFYRVLMVGGKLVLVLSGFWGWLYYKLGLSASRGKYGVFHVYWVSKIRCLVSGVGFADVRIFKVRSGRFRFGFDYLVEAVKA